MKKICLFLCLMCVALSLLRLKIVLPIMTVIRQAMIPPGGFH